MLRKLGGRLLAPARARELQRVLVRSMAADTSNQRRDTASQPPMSPRRTSAGWWVAAAVVGVVGASVAWCFSNPRKLAASAHLATTEPPRCTTASATNANAATVVSAPLGTPFGSRLNEALAVRAQDLPVVTAELTTAPQVPPPVNRSYPARVVATINTTVERRSISNQVKYDLWTFNGSVPGPFIRARVGDLLEVRYTNNDQNAVGHNIDFHAVSGSGGGSAVLNAEQGEVRVGYFRLLYPGLFIYHCAAAPVPAHIANGMYGLVLVEPLDGLPPVDREFYVLQSEFYTEPSSSSDAEPGLHELSYQRGLDENPNLVVFNGREDALTRSPLVANKGERVRLFVGNAGPNLVASFHIIGSIMDTVYREGDLISPPARGLQTTLIPAGGAAVVELQCSVPGTFTLVDHSIFRLDKGAVGFLKVVGAAEPEIYSSADGPSPCVGCKLHN